MMIIKTKKRAMRIFLIFNVLCVSFLSRSLAQSSGCTNIDFSMGDFTNWTGYTSIYPDNTPGTSVTGYNGIRTAPPYYYNTGIVPGRHTIITTSTPDPFTCGKVMTLPPGETQCVRLGNGGYNPQFDSVTQTSPPPYSAWTDGVRYQRDYLTYTVSVTPNNTLLIYKYAIVLQDPTFDPVNPPHPKALKPRFIVSVMDSKGKLIDTLCRKSVYYADTTAMYHACVLSNAKGLGGKTISGGDMVYIPWTTTGVDLRNYIGQNITLQFETWDCGLGAHFGYAYVTAKCAPMEITKKACNTNGSVTLTAPAGFNYKWLPSGDTTQSIQLANAKTGDTAYVELSTTNGCKTFLRTSINNTKAYANFVADTAVCVGHPVHFSDSSKNNIISWKWDFNDGNTSSVQNPDHIYSNPGTYSVKLIVSNNEGCTDSISRLVKICSNSVSIHQYSSGTGISIYPNPSNGLFTLETNLSTGANGKIEIVNVLEKIIYSEQITGSAGIIRKDIDIKDEADGLYFLIITKPESRTMLKLIKN